MGPLAGVRVVELAGLGPAPFAGMLLADLGAAVVRIDRPDRSGTGGPAEVMGRGKVSVCLDLKTAAGRDEAFALIADADVVIEGFRPGVMERLGLGPDDVLARSPHIVYGRMTGWGQTGPAALTAGHDITYLALTGALGAIGRADGPPQVPLNLLGDFGGGAMLLVVGILAALHHVAAGGPGQVVDAAIVDGVELLASQLWGAKAAGRWRDQRGVNRLDTGWPHYDVYETADHLWMAVGALEKKFFDAFLDGLGLAEWSDAHEDESRWPALHDAISARFATRSRAQWCAVFAGTDACVAPVLTWDEAAEHPHLLARRTVVEVAGVRQPAPAPRFSATPLGPPRPAPTVGAPSSGGADRPGVRSGSQRAKV